MMMMMMMAETMVADTPPFSDDGDGGDGDDGCDGMTKMMKMMKMMVILIFVAIGSHPSPSLPSHRYMDDIIINIIV